MEYAQHYAARLREELKPGHGLVADGRLFLQVMDELSLREQEHKTNIAIVHAQYDGIEHYWKSELQKQSESHKRKLADLEAMHTKEQIYAKRQGERYGAISACQQFGVCSEATGAYVEDRFPWPPESSVGPLSELRLATEMDAPDDAHADESRDVKTANVREQNALTLLNRAHKLLGDLGHHVQPFPLQDRIFETLESIDTFLATPS